MNMQQSITAARVNGPQREADGSAVFEFRFPATDPVFAGHFPGRPILPGVFQMEMARVAAELVLGQKLIVHEIAKARFSRPILPDETVRLQLKLSEKDGLTHARAGLSVNGQAAGETILFLASQHNKG